MPTTREVLKKYTGKALSWALGRLVDGWVKKAKEQPILAPEMLTRIRLVRAFVQETRRSEMPQRDTSSGFNGLIVKHKERVTTYRCRRLGKLWEDRRPWGYSRWAGVDELVSPDWESNCQGRQGERERTLVCNVCSGLCNPEIVSVEDVER